MTALRTSGRTISVIALTIILAFGLATYAPAQSGDTGSEMAAGSAAGPVDKEPMMSTGLDTNFECYECHSNKEMTPWIAETWRKSAHAAAGVKCFNCHGTHAGGFDSPDFTALPGPDVCNKCHPIKVNETRSGAHGGATKCTSCHPRHTFSLNVARNPMICSTCHTGNSHVDGYRNSKMGVVYMTDGLGSAATCQTCHMPGGIHNVSLTLKNREDMLKVCNTCHSPSFAGEVLKSGRFSTHW